MIKDVILAAVTPLMPCACLDGRIGGFQFSHSLHVEPPVYLSFGKGRAMVCLVCSDAAIQSLDPFKIRGF